MTARTWIALIGPMLALGACDQGSKTDAPAPAAPEAAAPAPAPAPIPTAATPSPQATKSFSVAPGPTACGAEMLQNYLNLLPTSTAKDEIARTLGHNRVRYVPLEQEKAQAAPGSTRVTAGLGVDGRIKEFACG